MGVPKYYEFMKPTLEIFQHGDALERSQIYEKVSTKLNLSDEDKNEMLPSGTQRVYINRIGWAITYLKKAGLLESPERSVFFITDEGRRVLQNPPEIIDLKFLKRYDGIKEFIKVADASATNASTEALNNEESPQDTLERAFQTISDSLISDLLVEVMNQSPAFFEKLVVDLLLAMGYGGSKVTNGKILGKTGDEGIDGVIQEDKLGFEKIYIQAKRWDQTITVGRPELQKFVGALTGQGATKGAFITTAKFSKEARGYVTQQKACSIVLIDGATLAALMVEHNLGVSVETTYQIKRIDTDYFGL